MVVGRSFSGGGRAPGASTGTVAGAGDARLGGYRLESLIGSGATADVWRAVNLTSGATVALKRVPVGAGADLLRERFAAEAAAAQRLTHPDIARVFASGIEAGFGWLAMELLPGTTLEPHTRPGHLLPMAHAIAIGARVAAALAHAHGQGVVHRDIKPSNVMIDAVTGRVALTDFGVASLADGERTRTGLMLGTPAYMAPELLAGAPASAAGDLYALGVLLFELLAGRRPHEAPTLGGLLRQVASESAPAGRAAPGVPADVAAVVAALLAKRPGERPRSAAEVAALLHRTALRMDRAGGGPKSRP